MVVAILWVSGVIEKVFLSSKPVLRTILLTSFFPLVLCLRVLVGWVLESQEEYSMKIKK